MKKIFLITLLTFLIAAPAMADPQVKAQRYSDWTSHTPGGEFTLFINDNSEWAWNPLDGYSVYAKDQNDTYDTFQTFCVEMSEHISLNEWYNVILNNKAMWGSYGPDGDPVSVGSALLYSQFAEGELSGYDYTPGSGRQESATILQKAFWCLEDEEDSYCNDNKFVDAAVMEFDSLDAAKADNEWNYPVGVLNITDIWGHRKQDQLVYADPPQTFAEEIEFSVDPGNKLATVSWTATSEENVLGYNIYRKTKDALRYEKINDNIILGKGSIETTVDYEFVDEGVINRTLYTYLLEEVEVDSGTRVHGPVIITPRVIFGIGR